MEDEKKKMYKLGIYIPYDLYKRWNRNFEWGERTRVLTRILEWTCEKVEKHGREALVLFLRESDINEAVRMGLPNLSEEKDGDDR